ncbi:MAG: hypothetical protein Q7T10_16115 [Rhodoferax sp.]|nr:hypothetical protein [Rhodoferax sp.]
MDKKPGPQRPRTEKSALKTDASSTRAPPLGQIPVSAFAPVQLPHPLEVFGERFEVHISSALTLSLETAMQAVLGTSVQTLIRTTAPLMHQNLKKLLYAGRGMHKPSSGTKRNILQDLGRFIAPEALALVLDGREPPPGPPESDWQSVLRSMNGCDGELLHDIASHMATYEHKMVEIRSLALNGQLAEARTQFQSLLGSAEPAWQELNPHLVHQVLLLVEVGLRTLAWLECRVARLRADTAPHDSRLAGFLDAGHRPMGHWLVQVMQASGCDSLAELSACLFRAGAKHHERDISHDLLKRWSSSKVVAMPHAAVKPVLRGVRLNQQAETLEARHSVARFLTFLCDLTRAGTNGEVPAWKEVQAQIKSRYTQVYRLELERQVSSA